MHAHIFSNNAIALEFNLHTVLVAHIVAHHRIVAHKVNTVNQAMYIEALFADSPVLLIINILTMQESVAVYEPSDHGLSGAVCQMSRLASTVQSEKVSVVDLCAKQVVGNKH